MTKYAGDFVPTQMDMREAVEQLFSTPEEMVAKWKERAFAKQAAYMQLLDLLGQAYKFIKVLLVVIVLLIGALIYQWWIK